jgi:hypothetical protein
MVFSTLMKFRPLALLALLLAAALPASAADLVGKWTSTFDSQIGQQKYAYEFKQTGARSPARRPMSIPWARARSS